MTKKILVADDSVTIHMIVNLTFAGEDVSVQAVADGARALEKAREFKPDVILADVDLPGLGGYELCERIKADPQVACIPVILLATTVEPFDEGRAQRVGYSGYLTKPFATDELIQVVQKACERKPEALPASAPKKPSKSEPDPGLVSQRTRESFLGADRILDIFGILLPPEQPIDQIREPEPVKPQAAAPQQGEAVTPAELQPQPVRPADLPEPVAMPAESEPAKEKVEFELSERTMNAIVERVVRHLSQDIVREVAWDVVPELAEIAIRQWLKEHMQKEMAAKTSTPAC
jgi:CheY-like chemotaxis protein